jgi:hypothetical protein
MSAREEGKRPWIGQRALRASARGFTPSWTLVAAVRGDTGQLALALACPPREVQ